MTLANSRKNLVNLVEKIQSDETDRNEAQTRFKVIDSLIMNCFGWEKDDINVEKHEDRQFTDYELGNPRQVILEAKREGTLFEIPAGVSKKLLIDLPSLMLTSLEVKEAIEQAHSYCSKRGVPIAVVTNGKQLIAFLASRNDGTNVFSGNALVFKSLEDVLENFQFAWQMLSKSGIKERHLLRYLSGNEKTLPNKLSSKLIDYPKVRYASQTQATLKQLSELFIQDIVETEDIEEKFFKECYCESGALSQYALISKKILNARYASLFSTSEPHPVPLPVKEKNKNNITPDILAESIARRPIVLLGDVGVGKTSFVKNLIYNSAFREFKNAIYIYIDLGSQAALTSDLKEFVLFEVEKQLNDKYGLNIHENKFIKHVYKKEISSFDKGVWSSLKDTNHDLFVQKLVEKLDGLTKVKDEHLKRSLKTFSNSSRKQVVISIDNADQRDSEIQTDAFIISQEIAKGWNAAVFVSVRPQTFYKSKRSGALTAYPHKVFTISPPRIDRVIAKRLSFALDMATGQIPIGDLEEINLSSENLSLFLKALIDSLATREELQEFLSNITGGNIRTAIELVTKFIGSPNVDAEKIIEIMSQTGKYKIPLHEFTKSALLGDYSHFSPDNSIAMNVFDVTAPDKQEHFICSITLAYLDLEGNHRDNDAFCSTDSLVFELQNKGYTEDQIFSALRRLTNKKLIETAQRITFEEDVNGELIGEMPASFRITTIGAYHLKRWLGSFSYLDAMAFDTPIFDSDRSEEMSTNKDSLSIVDRLHRTKIFKDYLIAVWSQQQPKPRYFDFTELLKVGDDSFERVEKACEKIKQGSRNSVAYSDAMEP